METHKSELSKKAKIAKAAPKLLEALKYIYFVTNNAPDNTELGTARYIALKAIRLAEEGVPKT